MVAFEISTSGDPEPDITWYKGDKLIKPRKWDKKKRITWDLATEFSILEIKNLDMNDSGEYTVKGTNKHGTTSATFNVIVQDKSKKKKVKGKVSATTEESSERTISMEAGTVAMVTETVGESGKVTIKEVVETTEVEKTRGLGPRFEILPQPMVVTETEAVQVICRVSGWV